METEREILGREGRPQSWLVALSPGCPDRLCARVSSSGVPWRLPPRPVSLLLAHTLRPALSTQGGRRPFSGLRSLHHRIECPCPLPVLVLVRSRSVAMLVP